MKTDDIIKLLDAGFTKEEILEMIEPGSQPKQKEPEPKEPEPKEPEPKEPEPKEPEEVEDPAAGLLKLVEGEFKKLRDELISSNITYSNNKVNSPEDPSQILANVVDPDGAILYNKERK